MKSVHQYKLKRNFGQRQNSLECVNNNQEVVYIRITRMFKPNPTSRMLRTTNIRPESKIRNCPYTVHLAGDNVGIHSIEKNDFNAEIKVQPCYEHCKHLLEYSYTKDVWCLEEVSMVYPDNICIKDEAIDCSHGDR